MSVSFLVSALLCYRTKAIAKTKMINKMNYRFKCLGISKTKSKGKWELNKKRLFYILGFESDISLSKTLSDMQTAPS